MAEVSVSPFMEQGRDRSRGIVPVEGFVFGDVEMDDYYMRILAVDLQIVIANVEYR